MISASEEIASLAVARSEQGFVAISQPMDLKLGNVAYRHGEKIEWDAENMRIPDAANAEQYLQREHRKGWKP